MGSASEDVSARRALPENKKKTSYMNTCKLIEVIVSAKEKN